MEEEIKEIKTGMLLGECDAIKQQLRLKILLLLGECDVIKQQLR